MRDLFHMQPILDSDKGLFNTFTGRLVDYNNLEPSMICLEDIATGAANISRFGGQIGERYTVAQHSMLVWHLAPAELKPAALLHDAAEAYLGDVIKPLKNIIAPLYRPLEEMFEQVIFSKYNVKPSLLEFIKPYDIQALEIEFNYFRYGKMDFIQKFYEIGELVPIKRVKDQYLSLLRSEFAHYEMPLRND